MATDRYKDNRDEFGRIRKDLDCSSHADRFRGDHKRREEVPPRRHQDDGGRGFQDERPPPAPDQRLGGEYYGPAHDFEDPLPRGTVVHGRISRLESYGAFMEFEDPTTKEPLRGLIHISQMASQRVEQVSDVVKEGQSIYAIILEVDFGREKRIRLSMKDVDQITGKYRGTLVTGGGYQAGSRPPPPRELARRSKQRRDLYLDYFADWQKGSEEWNQRNAPKYLRQLWSASPEAPVVNEKKKLRERKKRADSDEESASSSSSSDQSLSSSSGSDSSSDDGRRRTNRSREHGRSRVRRDRSHRRGRSSGRRKRTRSSSSESSCSSSSASSSSSSESSSTNSTARDKKRVKRSGNSEKNAGTKVSIEDQRIGLDAGDPAWKEAQALKEAVQGTKKEDDDSVEDGPMPLPQSNAALGGSNQGSSSYGKALLPGEGQAIAQYVQNNLRIPRRGEIGYSGDDIEDFEKSGYVMSGSRHQRMNAVRIRKENQVYSAEEQRALALITMEENQQKEAQLMEDFRTMLKEKKKLLAKGKG